MRTRLRDLPDLDATYPVLHDHRLYGAGHDLRARTTIALGQWLHAEVGGGRVGDLSAGNGAIAQAIEPNAILGDYAPGHQLRGRIEDLILEMPTVALYVCTETLEHLDDPDWVLQVVRSKAEGLVASLPECDGTDENGEHVWQFDREGGEAMLEVAGWTPVTHAALDVPDGPYRYHIWGCR